MDRRRVALYVIVSIFFSIVFYLSTQSTFAARTCTCVRWAIRACPDSYSGPGCEGGTGICAPRSGITMCRECIETQCTNDDPPPRPQPTTPPPPTATPVIACIDSDGGSVPNTYGEVTIKAPAPPQVLKDTCLTLQVTNNADGSSTSRWMNGTIGTHVGEKTCVNVSTGIYSDSVLACQYGCTNGACNTSPPTPTPVIYCNTNPKAQACPDGYVCNQPTMPPCPDGRMCKQVMPRAQCIPDRCPLKSKGDANCDGNVNSKDYDVWKGDIQGRQSIYSYFSADFNRDKTINIVDFEIWRATMYK